MISSVTFEIIVQEECGETVLDDLTLADMSVYVLGPQDSQSFDEVQDSVSKQFGSMDGVSFCGARSYEIVDPEQAYMSLTDRSITVQSTSEDDIGAYQVQVKVSLADQPAISKIFTFSVTIDPC
jgi:hypothetical protein